MAIVLMYSAHERSREQRFPQLLLDIFPEIITLIMIQSTVSENDF